MPFVPRPSQKKILEYAQHGGFMGVSAVPGSGKTHILSYLASKLITQVNDEQEVLIVTLVNAAVDNFRRRIDGFVREAGLLAGMGYRVSTLHSLAYDIVRERPSLVGLDADFDIVDDRAAGQLLSEVTDGWLAGHSTLVEEYLNPSLGEAQVQRLRRKDIPALVRSIAQTFIKRAKDRQLTPVALADYYRQSDQDLPLAKLGLDIYREYQARLARTGVDFDDLIRLASLALDLDSEFAARLRRKWPFILEDEAQDSSLLQERILRNLAGASGNWARVGDPNQAIYETFTTAKPENLLNFLAEEKVRSLPMPESGRSSASVIQLANHLIEWTRGEHPTPAARRALNPPLIQPTPPDDPQPNPPDKPDEIYFPENKFSPEKELEAVTFSVKKWLENYPEQTAAILVPRNKKGFDVANVLKRLNAPYVELLNSASTTRSAAGVLANTLKHLSKPTDAKQLATLFRVWKRHEWDIEEAAPLFERVERALQSLRKTEDYLWPRPGHDWLDDNEEMLADVEVHALLTEFRALVQVWHAAAILPIDQLLLRLGQDLFDQPSDLALTHKFALVLRQAAREHPDWRLPHFIEELSQIARNQRRFIGFEEEDIGFEPPPGKVTVATMHRAKGLEWDRVYLMGVNNYNFPSGQPQDQYFSEKWFIRDALNLEAETLAQLSAVELGKEYLEGEATEQARAELVKERLRLFYVGLTRAKQELVVTWNTGRQFGQKPPNQPASPWFALQSWLELKRQRRVANQTDAQKIHPPDDQNSAR
ncbi:MAG TPA: ATP-dependent helicase [Chloroflexi bacterium]|nr:ATP-dependent helicase [Chloroflexota bacterium]